MICDDDSCRITLPLTPKEILETYTVDVFDESIGALEYLPDATVITALKSQAWNRFGRRPIGDYDYEYWLDCFKEHVNNVWFWYSKTLSVLLDSEQISIAATKSVDSETTVRDMDGTVDETRSNVNTKDGTVASTLANGKIIVQSESKSGSDLVEEEANPDTEAGATKYLSKRTTSTPGAENEVTTTNSGNDVNTTNDDTIITDEGTTGIVNAEDETVTVERTNSIYDGLNAEAVIRLMDAVKLSNERFMKELEPMFLKRW